MISDKKRNTNQKPNLSEISPLSKYKPTTTPKQKKRSSKKKLKIKKRLINRKKLPPKLRILVISLILIILVGLFVLVDLPLWLTITLFVVDVILFITILVLSYFQIQRDRRFVLAWFIFILIGFPLVSAFVLNPSYPVVQFHSSEYIIGEDTTLNFTVLDKKSLTMYSEFSISINGDEIHTGKFNDQEMSIEIPYDYVQTLIPGEEYLINFKTRNFWGHSIDQKFLLKTINYQPEILSNIANFSTFEQGNPNAIMQWEIQDSSVRNSYFEIIVEGFAGDEHLIYEIDQGWNDDIIGLPLRPLRSSPNSPTLRFWDDNTITFPLCSLNSGTYSTTLIFHDGIGATETISTQFRILDDLAPTVVAPSKLNLQSNETHEIVFGINDFNLPKGQYEFYLEENLLSAGSYTAGIDIFCNLNTSIYSEGDYTAILRLFSPAGEVNHAFQVIIRENFDPIIHSVEIIEIDGTDTITVLVEIQDFQWGSTADVSIYQWNQQIVSISLDPERTDLTMMSTVDGFDLITLELSRDDLLAASSEFEIRVTDGFGGIAIYHDQLEPIQSEAPGSPTIFDYTGIFQFCFICGAAFVAGICIAFLLKQKETKDKTSSVVSRRISAQTKAILIAIFLTLLPNFFGIGLGLEGDSKIMDVQLGCRYAQNSGYVGEYNNTFYIHVFDSLTVNWSTSYSGTNVLRIRRADDSLEITTYRDHFQNGTQNQIEFVLDPENNQIHQYTLDTLYYVDILLIPDDGQISTSVSDPSYFMILPSTPEIVFPMVEGHPQGISVYDNRFTLEDPGLSIAYTCTVWDKYTHKYVTNEQILIEKLVEQDGQYIYQPISTESTTISGKISYSEESAAIIGQPEARFSFAGNEYYSNIDRVDSLDPVHIYSGWDYHNPSTYEDPTTTDGTGINSPITVDSLTHLYRNWSWIGDVDGYLGWTLEDHTESYYTMAVDNSHDMMYFGTITGSDQYATIQSPNIYFLANEIDSATVSLRMKTVREIMGDADFIPNDPFDINLNILGEDGNILQTKPIYTGGDSVFQTIEIPLNPEVFIEPQILQIALTINISTGSLPYAEDPADKFYFEMAEIIFDMEYSNPQWASSGHLSHWEGFDTTALSQPMDIAYTGTSVNISSNSPFYTDMIGLNPALSRGDVEFSMPIDLSDPIYLDSQIGINFSYFIAQIEVGLLDNPAIVNVSLIPLGLSPLEVGSHTFSTNSSSYIGSVNLTNLIGEDFSICALEISIMLPPESNGVPDEFNILIANPELFIYNPDGSVDQSFNITYLPKSIEPSLEWGTLTNIGTLPTFVEFSLNYETPIIIASPNYDISSTENSLDVQITNIDERGFWVEMVIPDHLNGEILDPQEISVFYLVVEDTQMRDFYIPGTNLAIQAGSINLSVCESESNWDSDRNVDLAPHIESDFATFSRRVTNTNNRFMASYVCSVGKIRDAPKLDHGGFHVGIHDAELEYGYTLSTPETVHYIVIETGAGTISGPEGSYLQILNSADIIRGIDNNDEGYSIPITGFSNLPATTIVTQIGMDGSEGSWPLIDSLSATDVSLISLEDSAEEERAHTTEQVSLISFSSTGYYEEQHRSSGISTFSGVGDASFLSNPSFESLVLTVSEQLVRNGSIGEIVTQSPEIDGEILSSTEFNCELSLTILPFINNARTSHIPVDIEITFEVFSRYDIGYIKEFSEPLYNATLTGDSVYNLDPISIALNLTEVFSNYSAVNSLELQKYYYQLTTKVRTNDEGYIPEFGVEIIKSTIIMHDMAPVIDWISLYSGQVLSRTTTLEATARSSDVQFVQFLGTTNILDGFRLIGETDTPVDDVFSVDWDTENHEIFHYDADQFYIMVRMFDQYGGVQNSTIIDVIIDNSAPTIIFNGSLVDNDIIYDNRTLSVYSLDNDIENVIFDIAPVGTSDWQIISSSSLGITAGDGFLFDVSLDPLNYALGFYNIRARAYDRTGLSDQFGICEVFDVKISRFNPTFISGPENNTAEVVGSFSYDFNVSTSNIDSIDIYYGTFATHIPELADFQLLAAMDIQANQTYHIDIDPDVLYGPIEGFYLYKFVFTYGNYSESYYQGLYIDTQKPTIDLNLDVSVLIDQTQLYTQLMSEYVNTVISTSIPSITDQQKIDVILNHDFTDDLDLLQYFVEYVTTEYVDAEITYNEFLDYSAIARNLTLSDGVSGLDDVLLTPYSMFMDTANGLLWTFTELQERIENGLILDADQLFPVDTLNETIAYLHYIEKYMEIFPVEFIVDYNIDISVAISGIFSELFSIFGTIGDMEAIIFAKEDEINSTITEITQLELDLSWALGNLTYYENLLDSNLVLIDLYWENVTHLEGNLTIFEQELNITNSALSELKADLSTTRLNLTTTEDLLNETLWNLSEMESLRDVLRDDLNLTENEYDLLVTTYIALNQTWLDLTGWEAANQTLHSDTQSDLGNIYYPALLTAESNYNNSETGFVALGALISFFEFWIGKNDTRISELGDETSGEIGDMYNLISYWNSQLESNQTIINLYGDDTSGWIGGNLTMQDWWFDWITANQTYSDQVIGDDLIENTILGDIWEDIGIYEGLIEEQWDRYWWIGDDTANETKRLNDLISFWNSQITGNQTYSSTTLAGLITSAEGPATYWGDLEADWSIWLSQNLTLKDTTYPDVSQDIENWAGVDGVYATATARLIELGTDTTGEIGAAKGIWDGYISNLAYWIGIRDGYSSHIDGSLGADSLCTSVSKIGTVYTITHNSPTIMYYLNIYVQDASTQIPLLNAEKSDLTDSVSNTASIAYAQNREAYWLGIFEDTMRIGDYNLYVYWQGVRVTRQNRLNSINNVLLPRYVNANSNYGNARSDAIGYYIDMVATYGTISTVTTNRDNAESSYDALCLERDQNLDLQSESNWNLYGTAYTSIVTDTDFAAKTGLYALQQDHEDAVEDYDKCHDVLEVGGDIDGVDYGQGVDKELEDALDILGDLEYERDYIIE